MNEKSGGRIGSLFDDYLEEEGIRDEVEDLALREIIADQLANGAKVSGITKSTKVARIETGRL